MFIQCSVICTIMVLNKWFIKHTCKIQWVAKMKCPWNGAWFGTSQNLTRWPLRNLNAILDVIFKHILVIDGWGIPCEIALIWISLDFTDDQSASVQVMAWCRQATGLYLSQCWPRSLSPYGVTRPQWDNKIIQSFIFIYSNKFTGKQVLG